MFDSANAGPLLVPWFTAVDVVRYHEAYWRWRDSTIFLPGGEASLRTLLVRLVPNQPAR